MSAIRQLQNVILVGEKQNLENGRTEEIDLRLRI